MVLVLDLHTKFLELKEKFFHFNLVWISTHVRKLFVLGSSQDLVDASCNSVGNSNFGLVCRSKPIAKLMVFGSIKRGMSFCGTLCGLNQNFS